MKSRVCIWIWWSLSTLLVCGVAIGVHYTFETEWQSFDLWVAIGLLLFNHAMFGLAEGLQHISSPETGLIPGFLWIGAKLFVNTFTIFLFIGLHAVRSPVFVPVFFIAYAVVLFLGILRIHIAHSKSPTTTNRINPDE